ncbi:MAG: hypothetical protein ACRDHV_01310 [Actinomycetota bacterium]
MTSTSFDRFAGLSAIAVGIGGLVYAGLFIYIVAGAPDFVRSLWFLLLLLGGVLTSAVLVGVYGWVRDTDPGLALWMLVLGLGGALGGILHGGFNLGVLAGESPGPVAALGAEAVSGGVLRYGIGGLGLLVLGGLLARSGRFPRALGYLAGAGGVLLLVTYAGRLAGFIDPAQRLSLIPPVLYGLVVHPVVYLWLGRTLWRGPPGGSMAPS